MRENENAVSKHRENGIFPFPLIFSKWEKWE